MKQESGIQIPPTLFTLLAMFTLAILGLIAAALRMVVRLPVLSVQSTTMVVPATSIHGVGFLWRDK
jgi:hypothetical protein